MKRRRLFGLLAAAPLAVVVRPAFARGGWLTSRPLLIGETGPELVLPRSAFHGTSEAVTDRLRALFEAYVEDGAAND